MNCYYYTSIPVKILQCSLPVHSLQYLSCSYNNNSYYVPTAFGDQSGFGDHKCRTNKGPCYLPKFEIEKDCGLSLQGFRVRGFASTKDKHQHTQQLLKLRKRKGRTRISGFWGSKLREF
jgi:hypothetical protein